MFHQGHRTETGRQAPGMIRIQSAGGDWPENPGRGGIWSI